MSELVKWIDLKDTVSKGRLKVMEMEDSSGPVRKYLFVVGLDSNSEAWRKAVMLLDFVESPNKKYLLRQIKPGDKITAELFRPVWPGATVTQMKKEDARLELKSTAKKQVAPNTEKVEAQEQRTAAIELGSVTRLGRNADGDVVFKSPLGRYIERKGGNVFEGSALLNQALFLRAINDDEAQICADGFVQAMIHGEVQHAEDFNTFLAAMTDAQAPFSLDQINAAATSIDAALMRHLTNTYQTSQDAYGDSSRLYELLPPYQGTPRGAGAMPIPLSIMVQRLMGDTAGKDVCYPDAYDGAGFAFLPEGTRIQAFRGTKNISKYARTSKSKEAVWGDVYNPTAQAGVDAMFINKDPSVGSGPRDDFGQSVKALRGLKNDGRAVIVLAAGENDRPGELSRDARDFYDYLTRTFELEAAFEIPPQLTNRVGTNRALRVVAVKNRRPREISYVESFPVMSSWDECKTYVDEAIVKVDLKEVESEGVDVDQVIAENAFQRPYISFSKTANATTMVPKNLQAPLQSALSNLEYLEGEIDHYVERELQFGENTLGERLSPEQIDAVALAVHRLQQDRAIIIGDETGLGKGRTISAAAVWANKQGKNVIFVTDKANLFSDLMRDLRDINEWGRFSPMVTNAGAVMIDGRTKEIIHEGTPTAEVKNIVENMVPMDVAGYNMCFTTYSQIASEDSPKAEWLLSQAENALLIVDEAHVAAGSDSNMSRMVMDLTTRAWGVVYSSATWAKSSENLHIYARAFPEAINISTLTTTMRQGGEAFSEVFSSMLAKDGALVRREHDLSKLEITMDVDDANFKRNCDISDQISDVLQAMTYVGGEINRMVRRSNADTMSSLRKAREVHAAVAGGMRAQSRGRGRPRRNAPVQETVVEQAPVEAAIEPTPVTLFKSNFGAGTVIYQVMRRVLAILNVDNVARLAITAKAEGRKPVIVFEDTGETFVREILGELTIPAVEGESAVIPTHIPAPTIRDLLMKIVKRMGVVQKRVVLDTDLIRQSQEGAEDAEVNVDKILDGVDTIEFDLEDLPGMSDAQKADYLDGIKRIVEMISRMPPLPLNVIDVLRARLKSADMRVGEISGRRMILEMPETIANAPINGDWDKGPERLWRVQYRDKTKKAVSNTTYDFNFGELDALVINRSAATGISLHASPTFHDQRRRELIEMQIPENPTDRIQLYGRVNRYDQVCGPRLSVATTGVYGEVRQIMLQNKKQSRLSANTRSSRESAVELKHVTDILNTVGEDVCDRFLRENAPIRQMLCITEEEMDSPSFSAASKLTSRVVLFRVEQQRWIYDEIYGAYEEEIIRLDLAGKNPLRAKEMDIRAKVIQSRIAIGVEMEGFGSAFDGPVYMRQIGWKQELQPLDWDDVKSLIKSSRESLLKSDLAKLEPMDRVPLPSLLLEDDLGAEDDIDPADLVTGDGEGLRLSFSQVSSLVNAPRRSTPERIVEAATDHKEILSLPARLPVCEFVSSMGQASPLLHAVHECINPMPAGLLDEDVRKLTVSDRQSKEIYSQLNLSKPIEMFAQVLGDRARLSLSGTAYEDLEAALRHAKPNAVRDMWAKKVWVERNFANLQPGAVIGIQPYSELNNRANSRQTVEERMKRMLNLFRERAIITALVPPAAGKEAQLSKWRVEVVVPGDEKVRQFSLSKLLEDVSLMYLNRGENAADLQLTGGPALYGYAFSGAPVESEFDEVANTKRRIKTSPRGLRDREAYVLEGNMYLASEWAQATGKGHGVVYTDESGARHRAVMLPQESLYGDRDLFRHLPIRLWVPKMINAFVASLWDQSHKAPDDIIPPNFEGDGFLLKTDFASAMSDGAARANSSQVVILPGQLVGISLEKKETARVMRALKSESKRIFALKHPHYNVYTPEQKEAAAQDEFKIHSTSKRGKQSMVYIESPNLERAEQAIDVIAKSIGLEIYLWPSSKAGQEGKRVVDAYFEARRDEAVELREQARLRKEGRGESRLSDQTTPEMPVLQVANG